MQKLLSYATLAEDIQLTPSGDSFDALSGISFNEIISGFITLALVIAALVFFFMLVIGGIRWILSGGDKGQTEAARNQITAALVGLVIVFAAWAISQLIANFFGVNIFRLTPPKIPGTPDVPLPQ